MGNTKVIEISAEQAYRELEELRRKDEETRKDYKDYLAQGNKVNQALLASKYAKPPIQNYK